MSLRTTLFMRIHTHQGILMSAQLIQMGNFKNLQRSTENVINRKFNVFVEYQIYFTRKAEFCYIFTRAAHS